MAAMQTQIAGDSQKQVEQQNGAAASSTERDASSNPQAKEKAGKGKQAEVVNSNGASVPVVFDGSVPTSGIEDPTAKVDEGRTGGVPFSGPVLQPQGHILNPDQRILDEERLARVSHLAVDTARRSMAEIRELLSRTEGIIGTLVSGGDAASLLSRVQSIIASAPPPIAMTDPKSAISADREGGSENLQERSNQALCACEETREQLERHGPDASVFYGRIAAERASSVLACVEDLNRGLATLEERLAASSLLTTDFNALHYLNDLRAVKHQLHEVEASMREMRRMGYQRGLEQFNNRALIAA